MFENIMNHKSEILEQFAVAYMAESGLRPADIELVEQHDGDQVTFFFQEKGLLEQMQYEIEIVKERNRILIEIGDKAVDEMTVKVLKLETENNELKKELHHLKEQDGRPYKGETSGS